MKRIVNVDETIGKTVGRRVPPDPLDSARYTPTDAKAWDAALDTSFAPRGVYRFATHEEADAWLMKKMIQARRNRNRANPPLPISGTSAES